MDSSQSFPINRGFIQKMGLFRLFGTYEDTLLWLLYVDELIYHDGLSLKQVRVMSQYQKHKDEIKKIKKEVLSFNPQTMTDVCRLLEEMFDIHLVIYQGDYTTSKKHGICRIPGALCPVYSSSKINYSHEVIIYKLYKRERILPNKSGEDDEYMYTYATKPLNIPIIAVTSVEEYNKTNPEGWSHVIDHKLEEEEEERNVVTNDDSVDEHRQELIMVGSK